ncbi:50S ribosomal protein L33 [Candidatus Palauibacter sp.]
MRVRITLECTQCKERNYTTTKNRRTHPQRAERKKYCRRCDGHTTHKETR